MKLNQYILFGITAISLRLVFNYSYELIPGINGGYYPLQVRMLIETGHLGFSDMPLYFYLNTFFVKVVSFFSSGDIEQIILHSSKIIDSISLPLVVIPLYLMVKNIFENKLPKYFEIIFITFTTLSFFPLILTSDLQKNAMAIPLMLFFLYFLLLCLKRKSIKHALWSAVFLVLTCLTHFGVFTISVFILLISLVIFYRKKALIPILGISILGILLVYVFDAERANRLLNIGSVIFERPVIFQGPLSLLDISNYLLSYLLIGFGIFFIFRQKQQLNLYDRNILITFLCILFILSFPLLDIEYARRFSLLLFIPQTIVLLILFPFFVWKFKIIISSMLVLITMASIFLMTLNTKPPSITREAFIDLTKLQQQIPDPENTLIIARHGLEWWVAWQLYTKVGQDKSVDKGIFLKYKSIIILEQLKGINQMHPGRKSLFHEPHFQTNQEPFYVSEYFIATELKNEDI